MPSVLFAFCTVYCSGNSLKINITPIGECSTIKLTELKFKIWNVTFFKTFLTTEKLWGRLQFSRNKGFIMCICIWDIKIQACNWKLDLFRLSSLVLASEWSSNRKLFVVLLYMTKCMYCNNLIFTTKCHQRMAFYRTEHDPEIDYFPSETSLSHHPSWNFVHSGG